MNVAYFSNGDVIDFSKRQECCDLVILCNGEALFFSKFVLINVSEYFKALFTSNFKEKEELFSEPMSKIQINKPKTLINCLLNYIMGKQIRLTEKNIFELLQVADEYLISGLKKQCEGFLMNGIDVIDPIIIINTACTFNLKDLGRSFYLKYKNKEKENKASFDIMKSELFPILHSDFPKLVYNWIDTLRILIKMIEVNEEFMQKFDIHNALKSHVSMFYGNGSLELNGLEIRTLDAYFERILRFYNNDELDKVFGEYLKNARFKDIEINVDVSN